MTLYRRGDVWWYDFRFQRQRHRGSTKQTIRDDAELVESQFKVQLRREAGGVAIRDSKRSPRIVEWAGVYYEDAVRRVTCPERIDHLLRVVLRFWGPPSKTDLASAGDAPYHDLHLLDPIVDPMWVERFEQWIAKRAKAGQTRNQYRSVMSQMYKLAMRPAYVARTGVRINPFVGILRDRPFERTTTVSVDELRAWLAAAGYHVRLAMAIAALAPKLRLKNVLELTWDQIDRQFQWITIDAHKTARDTGRPLVAPINAQLKAILEDARRRSNSDHVVTYHGRPVRSIRGGLQLAAKRAAETADGANLVYGRYLGITFHTIRHTMATMLAELGEGESLRKEVMGHERLETTQRYTHIRPTHQIAALERLSAITPIQDLVMRRTVGTSVSTPDPQPTESLGNSRTDRTNPDRSN